MISLEKFESFRKSEIVRSALKKHSNISTTAQMSILALDWTIIIAAAIVATNSSNWLVSLASVILIAGRQHALLVMMHEASHYRLAQNKKLNDITGDVFAAFPLLFSTSAYRKNHLAHHKYTNTMDDPDWVRKASDPDWIYPQRKIQISKILFKQLLTAPRDWMLLAIAVAKNNLLSRSIYWIAIFTCALSLNIIPEVLLYWVVPLFTVFPVFQRCRSMSEHFGLARTHEFNSSRNTLVNPLERLFFAPHNVSYHLLHHLYPSVPQYSLPEFHQELMAEPLYRDHAHTSHGFIFGSQSVLADLSRVPSKTDSSMVA